MKNAGNYRPLKLMAADETDLQIISACLQDAAGRIGDFTFLPRERRFAFVINRFLRECAQGGGDCPAVRVRTGMHFEDVTAARFRNLCPSRCGGVVQLLSVTFVAGRDGGGCVVLDFADGGVIRLEVESINAYLSDISAPWKVRTGPHHDVSKG